MTLDQVRAELEKTIHRLKRELPKGSTIMINGDQWLDVEIVCSGAIPDLGYRCCLAPGHTGRCWSDIKRVSFTPEVK